MKSGRVQKQKAEETRKDFNIVLIHQEKKFFISELFKLIQDVTAGQCVNSEHFLQYIFHVGCAINLHSISNSGLILGGLNLSKGKWTVFFTAVNPMNKEQGSV